MTKSLFAQLYGYPIQKTYHGPTPYYVGGSCLAADDRFLPPGSHMEAYFPASWIVQTGFDKVVDLVKRWCEILHPAHGTAGISTVFQQADGRSTVGRLAFPVLKRFPGLDYSDQVGWNTEGSDTKDPVIRTISWLNILDQARIKALGGLASIQMQLGSDCAMIPYDGGVIIKAGPQPELGDINRGLIPQTYRMVARLLKPLVFTGFGKSGWLAVPYGLDAQDETLKWLQRFD